MADPLEFYTGEEDEYEEDRIVFEMYTMDDMSISAIAAQMGWPVSDVIESLRWSTGNKQLNGWHAV